MSHQNKVLSGSPTQSSQKALAFARLPSLSLHVNGPGVAKCGQLCRPTALNHCWIKLAMYTMRNHQLFRRQYHDHLLFCIRRWIALEVLNGAVIHTMPLVCALRISIRLKDVPHVAVALCAGDVHSSVLFECHNELSLHTSVKRAPYASVYEFCLPQVHDAAAALTREVTFIRQEPCITKALVVSAFLQQHETFLIGELHLRLASEPLRS